MKLEPTDLEAIAAAVVEQLQGRDASQALLGNPERLGFTEDEAAARLGVAKHVLRDCRLRGEIQAAQVGRQYIYTRQALLDLLDGSNKE